VSDSDGFLVWMVMIDVSRVITLFDKLVESGVMVSPGTKLFDSKSHLFMLHFSLNDTPDATADSVYNKIYEMCIVLDIKFLTIVVTPHMKSAWNFGLEVIELKTPPVDPKSLN
jgi:hypothetical protein